MTSFFYLELLHFFKKSGPIPASFCLFSSFSCYNFNTNWKKHRWCAWDLNPGRRMVGADETTELWRPRACTLSNSPFPREEEAHSGSCSIKLFFFSIYTKKSSISPISVENYSQNCTIFIVPLSVRIYGIGPWKDPTENNVLGGVCCRQGHQVWQYLSKHKLLP